jgi:hypothetical protein
VADHGFRPGHPTRPSSPGLSSPLGESGATDDWVYRGNFRQEIGYPIMLGQFKLLPYVMGRFVGYTDSPANGSEQRLFVGTGVRLSTGFWKINDAIRSPLLDINRMRHVVEPEVHLFTSAQTTEREDVYIFDESVDAINDISAVQLALRQRWQTKRGGPGRWRSVDFLTLNLEGNFFTNQPTEAQRSPADFRGLFFSSLPEASIPRNSINADAMWRVSDTMVVLGDAQWNLDEDELATTSIGLAVQRDTRLSYFVGTRYIGSAVDATLASFAANYELTTKYALAVSQSINLSERRNQVSSFTVLRRYDRFFLTVDVYYDAVNEESGIQVGLLPQGFGAGTGQLANIFGGQ